MKAWLLDIGRRIKAFLIGIDDTAAAAVFPDQTDLTVSARCGMVQIDRMRGVLRMTSAESDALLNLGACLDRIQAHHCRGAIIGDIERAKRVLAILQPYADYMAANNLPTA